MDTPGRPEKIKVDLPGDIHIEAARKIAFTELEDASARRVIMPFVEDHLETVKNLMGPDCRSYGVLNNRKTLDAFLSAHFRQGLSSRLLVTEELFHPSTLEAFGLQSPARSGQIVQMYGQAAAPYSAYRNASQEAFRRWSVVTLLRELPWRCRR
ncbi:hypothetical protein ACQZ6F_06355 [Rhizobium sp. A22-96]